eukprot:TRINITY_DN22404_c0_g1_i1.p1 TRINITY_DN22404_c0_g1~~TRINITY_DN22404_c0_g1_i1.p1  ORF type:complete len:658 (+),score=151.15 TRINITY_DN22404_c0_g1_i1:159-2132(+)
MTSYEEGLGDLEQRIDQYHQSRKLSNSTEAKMSKPKPKPKTDEEGVARTADFVRTVGFGATFDTAPAAPGAKSMSVAIPIARTRPAASVDEDADAVVPRSPAPVPDLSPTFTAVQPDVDTYKSQLSGWSTDGQPVPALPSDGGKRLSPTLVPTPSPRSPTKLGRSPLGRSPGRAAAAMPIAQPLQKESHTAHSTPPNQAQQPTASAPAKKPQQQQQQQTKAAGRVKGAAEEAGSEKAKQAKQAKPSQKPADGKPERPQQQQQQQAKQAKNVATSQDGKPRAPTQFDDPKKKKDKQKILQLLPADKQVSLFGHLPQYEGRSSLHLDVGFASGTLHPAILRLGLKYAHGFILGSNARCLAMLSAFKQLIADFSSASGLFFREFDISRSVQFLVDCRPMAISMGNAITYVKRAIAETKQLSEPDAKLHVLGKIDNFIRERITLADGMIATSGANKIQNGDVILTYARSNVVELLCLKAKKDKKSFRVIVVDSRPKKEGKRLLKALVEADIECTYVLINAVSYVMKEVSKVFVGAYAMMANGNLISRVGTAIVAMMAQNYHVPFIVCCESYKFTERVQLESISFNEIGDPDELVSATDSSDGSKVLTKWKETRHLKLLNLRYDLTPSEFIKMVITEHGMVPPSSVSVILREYRKEPDIFED